MIYRDFKGEKLSMLGFGTMRFPLKEDKTIDVEQVREMVRIALDCGVNYFDTAYPYMGGKSEPVIGEILSAYPRSSFYLATKYPGHQIQSSYHPEAVFEDQLKRCRVDYFDFYLLHNIYENSIGTYKDPQWNMIPYFVSERKAGRIRHLGFSCHAQTGLLKEFLEYCRENGYEMEFCQIQLNYLDWSLQNAKEKIDILNEYHIPVWVMEPVRGGSLARLSDAESRMLSALDPDETPAGFAFRFLQDIPGVTVVLSGMSSAAQMRENADTFRELRPLSDAEKTVLFKLADGRKDFLPCTACRYCTSGCPMELDIPVLIATYNEMKVGGSSVPKMRMDALPQDKWPSACIGCGSCAAVCPQSIAIPDVMRDFTERLSKEEDWAAVCRAREKIAVRENRPY